MKIILFTLCLLGALLWQAPAHGQSLVFSNQVITVAANNLSLVAVRYAPQNIVTNATFDWVESKQITTNGLFAGGAIVTNSVSVQQPVTTIATNAARWVADVQFTLPRGYKWALNGLPVEIERFSTNLEISLQPAAIQAVFGPVYYDALVFAASTGNYQPVGMVKDGFLSVAAQALAAGVQ